MARFQYRAIDEHGAGVSGTLEAANDADLERRLRAIGLDLVGCRLRRVRKGGRRAMPRRELIALCFELEQITRAGLPLAEGLRDLRDGVDDPKVRDVLASIVEDIEGGRTLSQSMTRFPREFSPVLVSLIHAGEQSGRMTQVLENLTRSLRWEDELRAHSRKLMIYPLVVSVVVVATLCFLLTFLVPQVVTLFRNMGLVLPLHTRMLIAASDLLVNRWWAVLGLALSGCAIATVSLRSPRGRQALDRCLLRLPVLGPILHKIALARFASFFALMYQSGITVLDALKSGEGIVGNRVIAQGLARASAQIVGGRRLSEGLAATGLFPPLVIRMTRVGENTGGLDNALLNVNYLYEREVREGIEQALKLIEPMMTLVLGGVLALVLFAVLGPLYDVVGRIKP